MSKINTKNNNTNKIITNEDIIKYRPLVNKIVQQMLSKKLPMLYNDIFGYGNMGLIYAYNTFKTNTSQSFTQYAAWCIRNFILTGMNEEGHIVKYSAYAQKLAIKNNIKLNIKSIDNFFNSNSSNTINNNTTCDDRLEFLGTYENNIFSEDKNIETAIEYIYNFININYNERDKDIFCSVYGLKQDKIKGKDLAKKYNISSAAVTIITQNIIKNIKSNKKLINILIELLF